jgi:hypothetical protein
MRPPVQVHVKTVWRGALPASAGWRPLYGQRLQQMGNGAAKSHKQVGNQVFADMSPDQEHRLEEIFNAVRNLPPPERAAFLERACGGDAALRQQVDSLLAAHEQAGQFLQPTIALSTPNALAGKPGDRPALSRSASQSARLQRTR